MQRPESPGRPPFRGGGRGGFDRGSGGYRRAYGGPGGPSQGGQAIDYRGLVEYVAKSVAENPDAVQVYAFERGGGALAIKVKMADEDVGRLIGKSGRNIEALRTIVRVASQRERRRVFVDLAPNR